MKKTDSSPEVNNGKKEYGEKRFQETEQARPKKKKKSALIIVLISLAVFLLVAVGGFVTVYTVVLRPLDAVSSLSASDFSDSGMSLSWNKVERADGYHIYMCTNGGDDYDLYQTIEDPDVLTLKLSDLQQATQYSFYVTAYNRYVESENSAVLQNAYTLPEKAELVAVSSEEEGIIHIEWSKNERASGYVIEYRMTDKEYFDDNTIRIDDPETTSCDIGDLEPRESYTVRMYSFLAADKERKGAYSEEKTVEVYKKPIDPEIPVTDPNIDPTKPMIAFSFDDGPYGDAGERILDTLEKYGAKATFFMVGCYAESNESNLTRKVNLGMELGNHTWNHSHYGDDVTAEDIRKCSETIYDVTGKYPTAFRSPGGMTTDAILSDCEEEGMPAYYWSIDTRDWETRDADKIYHEVMDHVQDGDIILMHEIYDSTADAVEKMVPELIEKGYQIVTCHDLMTAKTGEEPSAGVQYYHAR